MKDTTGIPLPRAIAGLAIPAALAFLLHNAYHLNDTFFLGRFVGADATNAMGLFMMVSIANFGFILTLARGTQSLVGRRLGAGQRDGVQKALCQGLLLANIVLLPIAVLEWIFIPDILRAIGGEGATVTEATAYVRALLVLMPGLFASPIVEFAFQGMGDTRTPFKLQCLAILVNTALNAVLIPTALPLGSWLGLGDWELPGAGLGVMGAAIATGVSRCCSAALGLFVLWKRERFTLLLDRDSWRIDGRVAREILRVGVPAGSSTFLFALVGFFLTDIIGGIDQDALGGYAIGFRGVESVSFMIVLGFGVGAGAVAAHAAGAGDYVRARAAGHVGALMCAGIMVITTTVYLLFAEPLCGLYTDDPALLAVAATYIAHMAWCQVPQAFEMVYGDAMAGAGSSSLAAVVSIPGNLLRVPLALLFSVQMGLGLEGVWYAIIASSVLKGAGMTVLFLGRAWERGMVRGREALG